MKKLYEKSEISFAIFCIVLYVVVESIAENLSQSIGIKSSVTAAVNLILTAVLFIWVRQNGLLKKYGLCKTTVPKQKFLWYIPLVVIASVNLWNGVAMSMPVADTVCRFISMLCVGFLEELIFRGFLFKAMAKDSIKQAVIISSITFGLGHVVNLFNGRGMDLISNVCQIFGAVAVGFLFVMIFHLGGSLLPCVLTHSAINATSVFSNELGLTAEKQIVLCIINLVIALVYAFILQKTLVKKEI